MPFIDGSCGVSVNMTKAGFNLLSGLAFVARNAVWVGIPQESSAREGPVTNAQLLYIHENGSPVHNIPPRPVMQIGLSKPENASRIRQYLNEGIKMALLGNKSGAEIAYHKAGMIGENAVKSVFGSGEIAPNAPSTVARKGSSAPLIDTGSLRNAITHVIRKR